MAEIAIAALIGAAVSGLTYTITALTAPKPKPVEKGRLQGEIQIQDSSYGAMIPIILGSEPRIASVGCDPGPLRRAHWTDSSNLTLRADGSLEKTGGSPNTYDAHAYSTSLWAGTQCVDIRFAITDDKFNRGLFVVIETEDGDSASRHGFWFGHFVGSPIFDTVEDGVVLSGPDTVTDFPQGFRITTDGAGNGLLAVSDGNNGVYAHTPWHANFTYDDTKNWRVHVMVGDSSDFFYTPPVGVNAFAPAVSIADGTWTGDGTGGGCRIAGNVIWMSEIRKVETTTPASGGKGGGPATPASTTIEYFCDLAIMWGEGELIKSALYADSDLLYNARTDSGTGMRDPMVGPDPDQDHLQPLDPSDPDIAALPSIRFGNVATLSSDGVLETTLSGGGNCTMRFYSGSETQPVDPLIEADMGVGATPAYLGRSYTVLQNFNVSKYGRIPNFTSILSNLNYRTASQCIEHLASRVNLEPTDYNLSDADDFDVRGIPIFNRTAPRPVIELMGQMFAFDVVEANALIKCVVRGGPPTVTILEDDLGVSENDPQSEEVPTQITNSLSLNQTELPKRLDIKFFDPGRDGEVNSIGAVRLASDASSEETQEINAVLTVEEARRLAQRLLDSKWIEARESIRNTVPHTYTTLEPGVVATVVRSTVSHTVRIKELNGFIPGALEIVGISTRADSYTQTQIVPGTNAGGTGNVIPDPPLPATTVVTFIDRILRDRELQDGRAGFYAAACSFGNGQWGGANVYRDAGSGYAFVVNLPEQATMGVVISTDATIGGATVIEVELYGDQTLDTYTSGEVTAGAGYVLIGNLIFQYETATQLTTSPNRWQIETLSNIGARCTTGENGSHAAGERFVVLNQALRYVAVESDLINVSCDYKVPTTGQDINDAGTISFTVTAPNITITTPADYALIGGADGSITHNATPFSDPCVMSGGLIYEIHDDASGSPGALIYSGSSLPYKEVGLVSGTYTRHFRARSMYSDGAYEMRSITLTVTSPPNVDQFARDIAQRALGIAMQARGQGGASGTAGTEDDVARYIARTALGIAQDALRSAQANADDVLKTQVFS